MNPNDLPITSVMLACGVNKVMGESLRSFEMQTHPNKKLLIVCSHPQTVKFDRPIKGDVEIIKVDSKAFKNLGDKTRFALSLVKTEAFNFHEWDDLFFPHHLAQLAKYYCVAKEFKSTHPLRVGHDWAMTIQGGSDKPLHTVEPTQNLFFCRFLYELRKGHYDQTVENPFDLGFSKLPWRDIRFSFPDEAPGLGSRWDNGDHHGSGWFGSDTQEAIYRKFEDIFIARDISAPIEISWKHDYMERVRLSLVRKGFPVPSYLTEPYV